MPENIARSLSYRRLRAPSGSGQSLQDPPLSKSVARWNESLEWTRAEVDIGGVSLNELQRSGRSELLDLAISYTHRYRDVDLGDQNESGIVMSGHQPILFHPGVWFKNFALSAVARTVGATPINLIVDNDVAGAASIKCPVYENDKASVSLVDIDEPYAAVPYESRPIIDESVFGSFGQRAAKQVAACFGAFEKQVAPLALPLWEHVNSVRHSLGRSSTLGAVLAAARHRLEQASGLETLEVPVGSVAQTNAFARFAAAVIRQQVRFNRSYNQCLLAYRDLHRIRSNAHPVPELQGVDGWLEAPFWVWSVHQPIRRRLFVKSVGAMIQLTDRQGWTARIDSNQIAQAWKELNAEGVALRPRALITTMFCRLVLSDLFLHGIGGAKYDQLTDTITEDFFGIAPPPFSTLTATMHLPLGIPNVTRAEQTRLCQQIRQRIFHPEKFIEITSQTQPLVDRKQAAITALEMTRIDRHGEIDVTNRMLQPFVAEEIEQLRARLEGMPAQIRNSQILNSREYSFCLFPESVIEDLRRLAESKLP